MANFTVRLYGASGQPLRTEELWLDGMDEAREWARSKINTSQTFERARVYRGDEIVSEVGFQPRFWSDF